MPELRERSRLLAEIGANIRRLRVGSKRSQQTLSELADLDLRTIQRIEAGKIDVLLRTLDKIRRALDCDWKDILPRGGKP